MLTILEYKFKLEFSVLGACNNDTLEKNYIFTHLMIFYIVVFQIWLLFH